MHLFHHQFGIATKRGCKICGPWQEVCHWPPPWLCCFANQHCQSVLCSNKWCSKIKRWIAQLLFFVCFFHIFESPLYFTHCNQKSDVTNIALPTSTHQGDLLGGAMFAIANFLLLRTTTNHFHHHNRWRSYSKPFNKGHRNFWIFSLPTSCHRLFNVITQMCDLVPFSFPIEFLKFQLHIIDGGHLHPKLNCGSGVGHISISSIHWSPTIPHLIYLQL